MRPLTVGEVMTRDLVTMGPEDNLAALRDLMRQRHVRHIPDTLSAGMIIQTSAWSPTATCCAAPCWSARESRATWKTRSSRSCR